MHPRRSHLAEVPVAQPVERANGIEYLERNRSAWDRWAREYIIQGRRSWTADELRWGMWDVPESELRLVESLHSGADVVELGCGTASTSSWLVRLGLRPVAVDFSRAQLDTAERLQREFRISFPLILANAEAVPFDDDSFDLAFSEYGACLWSEPRKWVEEAHRLLRPGGTLVFFTNSPLLMACTPPDGRVPSDRLVRDHFSNDRVEFPGDGVIEFHLSHERWIRLLRAAGFTIENLTEVRPPRGAKPRFPFVTAEWAQCWPSEDIWVARKAG
jgi:SAM-dependent methyltransferase